VSATFTPADRRARPRLAVPSPRKARHDPLRPVPWLPADLDRPTEVGRFYQPSRGPRRGRRRLHGRAACPRAAGPGRGTARARHRPEQAARRPWPAVVQVRARHRHDAGPRRRRPHIAQPDAGQRRSALDTYDGLPHRLHQHRHAQLLGLGHGRRRHAERDPGDPDGGPAASCADDPHAHRAPRDRAGRASGDARRKAAADQRRATPGRGQRDHPPASPGQQDAPPRRHGHDRGGRQRAQLPHGEPLGVLLPALRRGRVPRRRHQPRPDRAAAAPGLSGARPDDPPLARVDHPVRRGAARVRRGGRRRADVVGHRLARRTDPPDDRVGDVGHDGKPGDRSHSLPQRPAGHDDAPAGD